MHIHITDKWVLCKNQLPFDSFVLHWKCKAYDSGNVPEEISKTPLTSFWLKALVGEMRRGEGSYGGGIKIHGGSAAQSDDSDSSLVSHCLLWKPELCTHPHF